MSGLFGSSTGGGQQQSNPFGSSTGTNLFASLGSSNNNAQTQSQQSRDLFAGLGSTQNTSQPQQASNPFASASQQQQGPGMFGSGGASQPQQNTNPLGNSTQGQQGGGAFGSFGQSQQQPQPGGNSFGMRLQPNNNGLGASTNQSSFAGTSLGGSQQQQNQGGSLLGLGLGQSQQAQGGLGQGRSQRIQGPGTASLWQPGSGIQPRQKTTIEQLDTVIQKWIPESPEYLFQYYFYNQVGVTRAPYYRPQPDEDEKKWEDALSKKPGPGYIPVRCLGFSQMNERIKLQHNYIDAYNVRLHEIYGSLTAMQQKHELIMSVRAADARRKHQALSRRCLVIAAKVQVLRNRGYALSGVEEDLKQKLVSVEKRVMDPALEGRSEEIWARMVALSKRARILQEEMKKVGNGAGGQAEPLDEEVMKKAAKILEDYASQIAHLQKEVGQIQIDFKAWAEHSNAG